MDGTERTDENELEGGCHQRRGGNCKARFFWTPQRCRVIVDVQDNSVTCARMVSTSDFGKNAMPTFEPPYYPIIYVRGFAGSDDEVLETVADPYMGFNLGSTKFRQTWEGDVRRHYFESPLYRLTKDNGYTDAYSHGQHMPPDVQVGPRTIVIYRYYDEQFYDDLVVNEDGRESDAIGGKRRDIEHFAKGLSKLILQLRDRICGHDEESRTSFKVYLVAHSMGGLVCRCFLQNDAIGDDEAKKLVDKVFTYATPHNGIDFRLLGNVPGFFSKNNIDNFNRDRMREYLGLPDGAAACDLNGKFDARRMFNLVGTNWKDYTVAGGWSKRLTGPMSDGLVRIVNATSFDSQTKIHSPRAFVHRSHSGHFGIVNSEEGYQNLCRFLFGDLRMDGILELDELTLPAKVQEAKDSGKTIRASYNFEAVVKMRGANWDLHRRTTSEESAVFRKFDDVFPKRGKPRSPHLFTVFLSSAARVNTRRASLGFAVDLRVEVPEYVIDGFLWLDEHFNGSYLYFDTITIVAAPDRSPQAAAPYRVRYGFNSKTPNRATRTADPTHTDDGVEYRIPLAQKTRPGMTGTLLLKASAWN